MLFIYTEYAHPNPVQRRRDQDKIVIGILSHSTNLCMRNAHRQTTIPRVNEYKNLDIQIYFLLDSNTSALQKEQEKYGDLVFLSTSEQGWGKQFCKKLHAWYKYAVVHFSDALLIGRMDDDVFACIPQALDRLNDVKNKTLIYGYGTLPGPKEWVDDMYMFIGVDLARRLAKRNFCDEKKEANCLKDGHPGTRVKQWISIYNDFVMVNERKTNNTIFFYKEDSLQKRRQYEHLKTRDFCLRHIVYHKATASDIYDMHRNNSLMLGDRFRGELYKHEMIQAANCTQHGN